MSGSSSHDTLFAASLFSINSWATDPLAACLAAGIFNADFLVAGVTADFAAGGARGRGSTDSDSGSCWLAFRHGGRPVGGTGLRFTAGGARGRSSTDFGSDSVLLLLLALMLRLLVFRHGGEPVGGTGLRLRFGSSSPGARCASQACRFFQACCRASPSC